MAARCPAFLKLTNLILHYYIFIVAIIDLCSYLLNY